MGTQTMGIRGCRLRPDPRAARLAVCALVATLGCDLFDATSEPYRAGQRAFAVGDHEEARALWMQAAQLGSPLAQKNIGDLYAYGLGVTQNDGLAVSWYREAAEQGFAAAQHALAVMLEAGRGVEPDLAAAVALYRQAAVGGYPEAQSRLGQLYERGEGVPRDDARAAKWYRRGARSGDAQATAGLAYLYTSGRGVEKDPRRAVELNLAAAERGHVDAQAELGVAYASGLGVAADRPAAIYWLSRAADQGNELAKLRLRHVRREQEGDRSENARSRHLRRRYTSADDAPRPRRTAARESAERRNRPGRCRVGDSVLLIHRLDCMNKGGVFVESREGAGGFAEVEGSYDPGEWEWVWE
jgi:TPR repeat protein